MEVARIEAAVNEWMSDPQIFLVSVKIDRDNRITVLLDSDTDVSLENCIALTRFIESRFDREAEDYELTVSSYGLTQPLVMDRQLRKYIGKTLEVTPVEGKMFKATLSGIGNDGFTFERILTKKEMKEGGNPVLVLQRSEVNKVMPHITF